MCVWSNTPQIIFRRGGVFQPEVSLQYSPFRKLQCLPPITNCDCVCLVLCYRSKVKVCSTSASLKYVKLSSLCLVPNSPSQCYCYAIYVWIALPLPHCLFTRSLQIIMILRFYYCCLSLNQIVTLDNWFSSSSARWERAGVNRSVSRRCSISTSDPANQRGTCPVPPYGVQASSQGLRGLGELWDQHSWCYAQLQLLLDYWWYGRSLQVYQAN